MDMQRKGRATLPVGLGSLHSYELDNIELDGESRITYRGVQCPNCHLVMASSSKFNRLDYLCYNCKIMVHFPKKWAERYLHLR
jgi:hypothetical protein